MDCTFIPGLTNRARRPARAEDMGGGEAPPLLARVELRYYVDIAGRRPQMHISAPGYYPRDPLLYDLEAPELLMLYHLLNVSHRRVTRIRALFPDAKWGHTQDVEDEIGDVCTWLFIELAQRVCRDSREQEFLMGIGFKTDAYWSVAEVTS